MDLLFCLFVALRLKTTAMVIAGRSVHLAHFFLGKLEQAVNQCFVHVLLIVTDNNLAEGRRMTVDIISWSISTKSIRLDRDPTPDSWICRQTRICCQTLYRLCYSARIHYLNPYPATIFCPENVVCFLFLLHMYSSALQTMLWTLWSEGIKVSKGAKIRNQYNQVPHLTQDTNGKVTNSQLDTTNENPEVSPFPAGDNKAHINRHTQKHSKHKRSIKEVPPWKVSKIFYWRA